jgi:hypothetical protein
MTSTWALLGLGALVIALWLGLRARRYTRVFSDEHWREVARGMAGVKAAALARIIRIEGDEPNTKDDPRVLTTSAGLAIIYTVSERAGRFVHHCSISAIGGPTTHALGGTFTIYVAKLLGLPFAELRCEVAESTVHHAELSLDAAEHVALVAAPVPDVSLIDITALRREALATKAQIAWHGPARVTQE